MYQMLIQVGRFSFLLSMSKGLITVDSHLELIQNEHCLEKKYKSVSRVEMTRLTKIMRHKWKHCAQFFYK